MTPAILVNTGFEDVPVYSTIVGFPLTDEVIC